MNTSEIWKHIHGERAALADSLGGISDEQWDADSWCTGWTVRHTAGHVIAAAEQTFPNFYRELAQAGFRFHTFTEQGAHRLGALEPASIVERLRARTTTTNHPPAPVMAMLGEIIVHSEDIRRPLGLEHRADPAALIAIADTWKRSNLLIGAKRRIAGLRLRATDAHWSSGDGPEVAGPLQSLVVAMTGRVGAYDDLTGDGVEALRDRP